MRKATKIILQRILCFVLIASLVSQNGMQTVSARTNRPGRNNPGIGRDKEEGQKDSSDTKTDDNSTDENVGSAGDEPTDQPEIISEIEGRRGAFSKEYLRSDNSRTVVVYPQQVHYETEEGYENGSNSYELLITDNEESQGEVIYREQDYEISWQMVELLDAGTTDGADAGTGDGADVTGVSGGDATDSDGAALSETTVLDGEDTESDASVSAAVSAWKNKHGWNKPGKDDRENQKGRQKIHRPQLETEVTDLEEQEPELPEDEGIHQVPQSKVTLEGYSDGVSVEYEPEGDGVKENIILEDADAGSEFAFCLQTKGLVAELTDGNEIEFYDEETGELVYYFPAPFMIDNEGELSYDAVYELVEMGSVVEEASAPEALYIKIVLDEEWLGEASYPVIVDPVLKQCRTKNLVDSGCVVSNSTMRTDLYAGKNNTGTFRSYVRFDLPELPAQSVVTQAVLDLSPVSDADEDHYITASLVTENWFNTNTSRGGKKLAWNNQPGIGQVLDYTINGGSFDITKAVRQWMSGAAANYGVSIRAYDENVKATEKLALQYSKSAPYLKITYRSAVGLESYWGTHSTGAGTAGAGYINDYTGALTVVTPLVATAGSRFPMNISHVYNSNADGENKWHLNYEETIKIPIDTVDVATYPYVYTDSDGTEHYFKKKEVTYLLNGSAKTVEVPSSSTALPPAQDEDGLKLYIVPVTDSALKAQYPLKLIDKSASTVKYFDTFGRLALITDSNQFENGNNRNTKEKNCVTIGFESYGSTLALTNFDNAISAANAFKTQCYKSGVTATHTDYLNALSVLETRMDALKQDAYAKADYATARHIRTALTALAALNEVDSTPNKATIKSKSTEIVSALNSALTSAKTLSGNSNKRIKTVTDSGNKTATIGYNGSGWITSVSDPAYGGDNATLHYSGKNLTSVSFADGIFTDKNGNPANKKWAYFGYMGTLLASQQDTDGYKVTYTYGGKDNRIVKVSESHNNTSGQTYGIAYNTDNSTTFRFSGVDDVYGNNDDIQNIHVFDEQGRAVCIYSKSVNENKVLGATACTYQTEGDDGGTRNKIKDSAVVGMHANNLLTNHSFEYNDSKWGTYGTYESGALNTHTTAREYLGLYAACVNMAKRPKGTAGFSQSVSLAAGTYTLSAYVRTESLSNTSAYLVSADYLPNA